MVSAGRVVVTDCPLILLALSYLDDRWHLLARSSVLGAYPVQVLATA